MSIISYRHTARKHNPLFETERQLHRSSVEVPTFFPSGKGALSALPDCICMPLPATVEEVVKVALWQGKIVDAHVVDAGRVAFRRVLLYRDFRTGQLAVHTLVLHDDAVTVRHQKPVRCGAPVMERAALNRRVVCGIVVNELEAGDPPTL